MSVSQHPAFELLQQQTIDSLQIELQSYRHKATGALHYHLASEQTENVFMVALRTVPTDSTGVAHILEHTALCGSERYPVRDPFFMMIRRSLNTFMNAMTSSDWTAYPFASENQKDFDNLMQVYLDAVFFSRLDPLDFAQEGHRLEFADPEDPNSELVYKGVVYNEMKGAMSSIPSQLWQSICHHLFPTTTYHYNSGGDPKHIPELSYEQLKAFYQSHYHPSNAVFVSFGDRTAEDHHEKMQSLALSRFERRDEHIGVDREQRLNSPIRVEDHYTADRGQTEDASHVVMGWLLGDSVDLEQSLEAQFLASVLLDNSSSPLLQALETSDLGSAPSPLCGLEDSMRELTFVCGLEGCDRAATEAVEQMILATIEKVANEGVAYNKLAAVLHQLELSQREIGGDSYPYGLQLGMTVLNSATHYGDPASSLDVDPVLELLAQRIEDPDYIRQLAKRLLLDNSHRVTLTMHPDENLNERMEAEEKARLQEQAASLSEDDKQAIIEQTQALQQRQAMIEDESILPKVGIEDVAPDIPELPFSEHQHGKVKLTAYPRGTNGLVYQQVLFALPDLSEQEKSLLPLYTQLIGELGHGDMDYLAAQERQAEISAGINAYLSMRGDADDAQHFTGWLTVSTRGLNRHHEALSSFFHDSVSQLRFDEGKRIQEILAQHVPRREMSVSNNGHGLAMQAACASLSPGARFQHDIYGLTGLAALKKLLRDIGSDEGLPEIQNRLTNLHQRILNSECRLLLIAQPQQIDSAQASFGEQWQDQQAQHGLAAFPEPANSAAECWLNNATVNYCALAFPTVAMGHPDAAALTVLGGFLRNGFLHRSIREQGGAYGGGASQDNGNACFRFYSYRDPRLADTYADFDASLEWLQSHQHSDDTLEQAILGVIGSLDKPGSPAGEARDDYHSRLFGRNPQRRKDFRQAVLAVTINDLKRVAETYFTAEKRRMAALSHEAEYNRSREWIEANNMLIKRLSNSE